MNDKIYEAMDIALDEILNLSEVELLEIANDTSLDGGLFSIIAELEDIFY